MTKFYVGLCAIALAAGEANADFVNGGFETRDFSGWQVAGVMPPPVVLALPPPPPVPHSGTCMARVGSNVNAGNGDSSFFQTVTVPAGASLSFWHWDISLDNILFDQQAAYVTNASGTAIFATIMRICENEQQWINTTYDMSAFAGQAVGIEFLVHDDSTPGDPTAMYVDDVTMTPAPGGLALLGLGSLLVGRRRR